MGRRRRRRRKRRTQQMYYTEKPLHSQLISRAHKHQALATPCGNSMQPSVFSADHNRLCGINLTKFLVVHTRGMWKGVGTVVVSSLVHELCDYFRTTLSCCTEFGKMQDYYCLHAICTTLVYTVVLFTREKMALTLSFRQNTAVE